MPKSRNQKLKLLYLLKMLNEKTDENHGLTISEMIDELYQHGINAERKTLYDDLALLESFGVEILRTRTRPPAYYLAQREFELPELKLLADAVAASKFITEKKSAMLISKLSSLTSIHEAHQLSRSVIVANRAKTENERIFYSVDIIQQAISKNRQIEFLYFDYTIHKKKKYRANKTPYRLSPYALAWEDENYYCVGYYPKYESVSSFRVDKMESIRILDVPCYRDKDFSVAEYTKRVFSMFYREQQELELCFDNSLVGVVLDRFGMSTRLSKVGDTHFSISVKVALSPPLFAWLFQFGNRVKILNPPQAVQQMRDWVNEVAALYREGSVFPPVLKEAEEPPPKKKRTDKAQKNRRK